MPFRCKLTLRPELAWCALALLALRLSATASVDVSQHELPFAQVGTLLDATSGAASQEIAAANVADIASSPRPELALEPARLALMTAAPTRERSPHQDLTPLLANPPPELIERYPKTRVWGFGLPGPERIESGPSLTNRTHWGCELSWLGLASGYAFEVDSDHSYFVGQNALLVHNTCKGKVNSVWDLDPTIRGQIIEAHLSETEYSKWFNAGSLDRGYFPRIDFQKGRTVVSLKSADTRTGRWADDIASHIQDLSNGITVNGRRAKIILDLRVQPGGSAAAKHLQKLARSRGVQLKIKEF